MNTSYLKIKPFAELTDEEKERRKQTAFRKNLLKEFVEEKRQKWKQLLSVDEKISFLAKMLDLED